jgi:parallel beta-helix repeat protein
VTTSFVGPGPRRARAKTFKQGRRYSVKRLLCAAVVLAMALTNAAPAATLYVSGKGDGATGKGTVEDPYHDLQVAIDAAADGDEIRIAPGTYTAHPKDLVESLCGNCEDHQTDVEATVGFAVVDKTLNITGKGADSVILRTGAGYGFYFEDSDGSKLTGVTITGGRRDEDGNATDAGVVVRRCTVTLTGLKIIDNTDRAENEDVVVGIGGIMGREGAELFIVGNMIQNNGWDGIALYRGSTAFISDNRISEGRGAGIGVTWDATATVLRNRISGYWKGIGSFGSSRVVARNNAVFDNLGWGIVITGTSFMEAANNVVARNGNCGVALWSDEAHGTLVNNIIVSNGWREEWVCPPVGLWMNGVADSLEVGYNDVWDNAEGDYRDMEALTGVNGNISLDPGFADSLDFHLTEGSPCVDSGNPAFTDPDGGPSDMGIYGGPDARRRRNRE